ncbi:MAG: ISAzo13-like element transposase-related protein, partial [Thermoplasmataceae archaeon]
SKAERKAIPYDVYDIKGNEGWVSVCVDHDAAEFVVESIRMVEPAWKEALPRRQKTNNCSRWSRTQLIPCQIVEDRAAEIRR